MKIAIVGAGVGGLTLASLLRRNGIDFEVFERDPSVQARPQGYAIGLKDPGGLKALRHLGLGKRAEAVGRVASGFSFVTSAGKVLLTLAPGGPEAPGYTLGVPRTALREMLLETLAPDDVKYGMACVGYRTEGDQTVLRFEGGQENAADLVVACDGVNSALRHQMLGDAPQYLGLSLLGANVELALDHPLLRGNSFFMLGVGKSLFVQKFDQQGTISWSLAIHAPEKTLNALAPDARKARALEESRGWASPVSEIISGTPADRIVTRTLYDRDPPRKMRAGKVVLLGDAAHPMSPFQGQGANTAMLDALELAECLGKFPFKPLEECLSEYESTAVARCRPHVLGSRKYARSFHTLNPLARAWRNAKFQFFQKLITLGEKRP